MILELQAQMLSRDEAIQGHEARRFKIAVALPAGGHWHRGASIGKAPIGKASLQQPLPVAHGSHFHQNFSSRFSGFWPSLHTCLHWHAPPMQKDMAHARAQAQRLAAFPTLHIPFVIPHLRLHGVWAVSHCYCLVGDVGAAPCHMPQQCPANIQWY